LYTGIRIISLLPPVSKPVIRVFTSTKKLRDVVAFI
jgi:hypothetical protein